MGFQGFFKKWNKVKGVQDQKRDLNKLVAIFKRGPSWAKDSKPLKEEKLMTIDSPMSLQN